MVGVVGKSKACHDCRRRRVKCDLRRPTCLRCEKANLACRGYERATIFVNRTVAAPRITAQTVISQLKTQNLTLDPIKPFLDWPRILLQLSDEGFRPSISRIQFRVDAWSLLQDLYLPKPSPVNRLNLGTTSHYSWVQTACSLKGTSDALDYSLAAFCAIQVQITTEGTTQTETGKTLYIRALQELVKELENEQERVTDEALAAIVVLSTCELFSNPNSEGWGAHAHGISEILKLHNTSDGVSPTWRSLCARLRIVCVLLGLTKRQALDLDTERWRFFTGVTRTPLSIEGLMNMLSEVPQLMQQAAAALKSSNEIQKIEAVQSLLTAARTICGWRRAFRIHSPTPVYWAVPSQMHNPADDAYDDELFPLAVEFDSLDSAVPMILSAGVILQIFSTIWLLDPNLEVDHSSLVYDDFLAESGQGSPILAMAEVIARFLCQSIEYCHRLEMGSLGPQCTWHTQWSLGQFYRQQGRDRELEWVQRIKDISGTNIRSGMAMMVVVDGD